MASSIVKPTYKIPASLDRSMLDHEIVIGTKDFKLRPLPLKVIGFYVLSFLLLFFFMTHSFFKAANPFFGVMFVLWWIIVTIFMGKYSSTKEMRFMRVVPFFAYFPKKARNVITRRDSRPSEFYSIVGIDKIDDAKSGQDDGLIHFADGSIGRLFYIVGSASTLIFPDDRVAILESVNSFWRKTEPTSEYIFITKKEPQRVYHQIANMQRRASNLTIMDDDLQDLFDEDYEILYKYIGGKEKSRSSNKSNFESLHQYLLVKSKDREALRNSMRLLAGEVERGLMFRFCAHLNCEDTLAVIDLFYKGDHKSDTLL